MVSLPAWPGTSLTMRSLLVLAAFLVLLPAAAASTRSARITVPSLSPVVVSGTGFRASERVAVSVSSKSTQKKSVTASLQGRFRATFRGFSIHYCEEYSARAKGNRGSTAFVKVIPECAPTGPTGDLDTGLPIDPNPKKR
jgi:phosphate-selective porin